MNEKDKDPALRSTDLIIKKADYSAVLEAQKLGEEGISASQKKMHSWAGTYCKV